MIRGFVSYLSRLRYDVSGFLLFIFSRSNPLWVEVLNIYNREMKDIALVLPQDLHHAYVIEGGEEVEAELLQYINDTLCIETRGNPDVHIRFHEVFGIDDGRAIQVLESRKAVVADKKIFVLRMHSITREAQNALLKTLEEPTTGTHFFIIISSAEVLLPTLLSRVQVIENTEKETSLFAQQFLSSTSAERLALISEIIEAKDKQEALSLVNGLEVALYSKNGFNAEMETVPVEAFEALQSVRSYLGDRSASVKILLEHLSVTLPQVV